MNAITVRSTTGTAPLRLSTGPNPGEIYIELEDGSSQVYGVANLARALVQAGKEAHDA